MSRDRVQAVGEQTSLADRKRRAGQRLWIGIPGPAVDEDSRRLIAEIQPSGFVLFSRNVVEPAQVKDLSRELVSLVDPHYPALVAVDQEGGRVQRVRSPATVWPAMRALGSCPELVGDVSRAMARELAAMGLHLNFAPVADVDSNPANPIIGDRSFGRDPESVAQCVAAFVQAHHAVGVATCAKHFPGHGDTAVDSHLDLPIVEREDPDLRRVELPPFVAAVRAGVGSVMTAHVVYPTWDEERPATLSSRIVPQRLRGELGYEGLVFSDDMEMKAVAGRDQLGDQVRWATEATVDVLLCCESPELQFETFGALIRAQEDDLQQEQRATDSAARMERLRERFLLSFPKHLALDVVGCAEHQALADRVSARREA